MAKKPKAKPELGVWIENRLAEDANRQWDRAPELFPGRMPNVLFTIPYGTGVIRLVVGLAEDGSGIVVRNETLDIDSLDLVVSPVACNVLKVGTEKIIGR
jgi:hypothetical protein